MYLDVLFLSISLNKLAQIYMYSTCTEYLALSIFVILLSLQLFFLTIKFFMVFGFWIFFFKFMGYNISF